MCAQERTSFSAALECDLDDIRCWNLISGGPDKASLDDSDVVLIGGSGHYSAAGEGEWLDRALDVLRDLYESKKPTFASCWGFQAIARALGGTTFHDLDHAELGSIPVTLTDAGRNDPIFGALADEFQALQGHEDYVAELPPGAILLASTQLVPNQAFTFPDRSLYATQFHPELTRERYLERLRAYPNYIEEITGLSYDSFATQVEETPGISGLLTRFAAQVANDGNR